MKRSYYPLQLIMPRDPLAYVKAIYTDPMLPFFFLHLLKTRPR